jgi:hypothetical protein
MNKPFKFNILRMPQLLSAHLTDSGHLREFPPEYNFNSKLSIDKQDHRIRTILLLIKNKP